MVDIDKAHKRPVRTLAEQMRIEQEAKGVYEDGFYWARPVIENEYSSLSVIEVCSRVNIGKHVWATGDQHRYKLEDWVILEKVERK